MYTMLVLVCVNGRRKYLVREDMTNIEFLTNYFDSKPRINYIDELLYRMGEFSSIQAVLVHLLSTTITAEEWCRIPDFYMGRYNYSTENTRTTLQSNISEWLPCGVVVKQKYISPTTPEDTINIKVNAQLHINVTFIEFHMDSIVHEEDNPFLSHNGNITAMHLI